MRQEPTTKGGKYSSDWRVFTSIFEQGIDDRIGSSNQHEEKLAHASVTTSVTSRQLRQNNVTTRQERDGKRPVEEFLYGKSSRDLRRWIRSYSGISRRRRKLKGQTKNENAFINPEKPSYICHDHNECRNYQQNLGSCPNLRIANNESCRNTRTPVSPKLTDIKHRE